MTTVETTQDEVKGLANFIDEVGADHVLTDSESLEKYACDKLPYGGFCARVGDLPGGLPSAIVLPENEGEVAAVVKQAIAAGHRIIPFGLGSGVLGGAVPTSKEVVIDVSRLDGIVSINRINQTVTVRAGMNGMRFEEELNKLGYTCGHLPQSIGMSTVGGWAACRGAGQASSRFGKIEDIVTGLKVVLPSGELLSVRPAPRRAVGPSLIDLFVGSEGTLGIITEVTLRIAKCFEKEVANVMAFPSLDALWGAARDIMQAGLRPLIVRLYDGVESRDRGEGAEVLETHPFLGVYVFAGGNAALDAEREEAMRIIASHGGVEGPIATYETWKATRFESYSAKWQEAGYYMDTIEVSVNWSALPDMYLAMQVAAKEICPDVHFGAHWSHVYGEGTCQYMTIRLPPMEQEQALTLHARLWNKLQELTLDHDGSIAHHHGAGSFRNPWMSRELGKGLDVLQAVKDALDPGNQFNPGKLGLRPAENAVVIGRNG